MDSVEVAPPPAGDLIVGLAEVAARLHVLPQTARVWPLRDGTFPAPRWTVSGMPGYWWPEVEEWARRTDRFKP